MKTCIVPLCNTQSTIELGIQLAKFSSKILIIYLYGSIGVGKTTLSRGFIQTLAGYKIKVKSPTYTLVESYILNNYLLYHLDLYRIIDPEELEFIGIRDYFSFNAIFLIEWPENGLGVLPSPDLEIKLYFIDSIRREASLIPNSNLGKQLINKLNF